MRRTFDVAQVSDLRAEWRAAHPRGAIIVREGEKGHGLYLILKGRAVLFRGREGTDRHQILEVLGGGARCSG